MAGDLFQDLPPPTAPKSQEIQNPPIPQQPAQPPAPALKSALKRPKPPPESQPQAAPEKRLRFKTTIDASEKQLIDAMQKIASHIKNRSKFSKASKLAIQLILAGSVKPSTRDEFIAVLEASMVSLTNCHDPALREDYHALFSAAQDVTDCLSKKQQNQLKVWMIRAVWGNDLLTDDSFVFSKATGRVKESISNLPIATQEDDMEEAVALEEKTTNVVNVDAPLVESHQEEEESDPFGLDALIPNALKDKKLKGETDILIKSGKDDEKKRFLKSQREALVSCLEISAKRYKTPWCQTAIDILAKHAFENISKFTTKQREAVEKLWASIREQQLRRKQGKSVSGKLDVNAFEFLQQKYSNEKISIRHSVGGSGDRGCEQWLG